METEAQRRARTAPARQRRLARAPATRRAAWKAVERAVATYLGGARVPIPGRARGSAPDVEHHWLSIEVKSWERLPAQVADALAQAEAANLSGSKLPVAIIHANGAELGRSMVVLRLSDFREWFGGEVCIANVAHEPNGAVE